MSMPLYTLNGANGQLYVYDDHIEIERRGILGRLTHIGVGDTYICYSDIASVKLHIGTPLFSGYLYFHRVDSEKNCNLVAAAQDRDCVVFRFFENKKAVEIKRYIGHRI